MPVSRHAELTVWPVLLAALVAQASGCSSIDRAMLGVNDNDRMASLEGVPKSEGPMDRFLIASGLRKREAPPYMRPTVPPEAHQAYDEAKATFERGEFGAAEKAAHGLAKKYRNTILEEDALFLEAEAQFNQKRYAAAQDTYTELFERFPSTRYLDTSTAHLFEISQYWLRFPSVVKSSDIQPVNFDAPNQTPLPKPENQSFELTRAVPFLPNAFDRTRPIFDTEGRALEALKTIWLNDPTGSLADDALMLTASHYLRKGDFMEADHYYEILREEYPKSPHLEDAFVLGSHVKLMSYQGAAYDEKALLEAERLKESTIKLFPKTAERPRLDSELKKIAELEAERRWEAIQYWDRKGRRHEKSVAMACHSFLTNHPDSKHAPKAREIYAELPAEHKKYLPPLPTQPKRVGDPDLQPVPSESYGRSEPSGRVKL